MRIPSRTSLATLFACALLLAALPVSASASISSDTFVARSDPEPRTVLVSVARSRDLSAVRRAIVRAGGRVDRAYRYDAMLVTAPDGEGAAAFALRVGSIAGVRYAARNWRVHAVGSPVQASGTANDPLFPEQWGLPAIGATTAWDTAEGSGVSIAILDSGIDDTHPDLAGAVVPFRNYVNPSAPPFDDFGHGTHVSGIIAAVRNNGQFIAGAAPRAKVYALKVLDSSGSGDMADVIEAIHDTVDQTPCRVISMSFGGNEDTTATLIALQDAVDYARAHGRVVIAATGNEATTTPFYPAATPGVIGVGSVGPDLTRSVFSNYGAGLVDLVAPGWDIISTVPGASTASWYGTSMATPFVSASAALLWSARPDMSASAVEDALLGTAQDLGAPGVDSEYGYGLVRPDAAIAQDDTTAPQTSSDATATYAGSAIIHLTPTDAGGSGLAHTYYRLDGGATVEGTTITADSLGQHSLEFWSDDAAGNVETPHKSVTFMVTPRTYTITPSAGVGGSIWPDTPQTIAEGDPAPLFTITADSGFHIADVRLDGMSVGTASTYQFAAVTADHTIVATFAADAPLQTSITIRTSLARTSIGKTAVLSGAVTPDQMVGVNIVVYVMKPGRTYWSYSSNRTVYRLSGLPAWQYKYYLKPGLSRGLYRFKARCPAPLFASSARFAISESTAIGVTIR